MLRSHQLFYYVLQPLFQLHFVLLGKKAYGEKGVSGCSGTTWSFPRSGTPSNSASSLVTFSTSKGGEDGAGKLPVDAVSGIQWLNNQEMQMKV